MGVAVRYVVKAWVEKETRNINKISDFHINTYILNTYVSFSPY